MLAIVLRLSQVKPLEICQNPLLVPFVQTAEEMAFREAEFHTKPVAQVTFIIVPT